MTGESRTVRILKSDKPSATVSRRKRNSLPKKTAKERLHEFWNIFEKDDDVLAVISADPDSLASALAVKRLPSYRVKNVTIGYLNEIRRLANLSMLELLKIPAERMKSPASTTMF